MFPPNSAAFIHIWRLSVTRTVKYFVADLPVGANISVIINNILILSVMCMGCVVGPVSVDVGVGRGGGGGNGKACISFYEEKLGYIGVSLCRLYREG